VLRVRPSWFSALPQLKRDKSVVPPCYPVKDTLLSLEQTADIPLPLKCGENGKSLASRRPSLKIANVTDVLGERVGWEEELIDAANYAASSERSQTWNGTKTVVKLSIPDFRLGQTTPGLSVSCQPKIPALAWRNVRYRIHATAKRDRRTTPRLRRNE